MYVIVKVNKLTFEQTKFNEIMLIASRLALVNFEGKLKTSKYLIFESRKSCNKLRA